MTNAAVHPQYFGSQGDNVIPQLYKNNLTPLEQVHKGLFEKYKAQGPEVLPLFTVQHIYTEGEHNG